MSGIRLARGFTGRNKIIKFEGCYHGHSDSLLVKAGSGLATLGTSSSAGVPESFSAETIVLPLNDEAAVLKAIEDHGQDIACIIIEPIPANNGLLLQKKSYLEFLREWAEIDEKFVMERSIPYFETAFPHASFNEYGQLYAQKSTRLKRALNEDEFKNIIRDNILFKKSSQQIFKFSKKNAVDLIKEIEEYQK